MKQINDEDRRDMDMEQRMEAERFRDVDMDKYAESYSEDSFWDKIVDNVKAIGLKLIYKALQLFYVAQSDACPLKVRAGIYGALGYLISPLDLIPDFTPIAGYADDATAIAIALMLAQAYVTPEIKAQARDKISDLFGTGALDDLDD